jgi:AraC-like DNA-binding protein
VGVRQEACVRLESQAATVATVLEPTLRARLDAAGQGYFAALHADSLTEALRAVRERPVHAVLVSPRAVARDQLAVVGALVSRFPGVPTVAVVSAHDRISSERLLELGACGVSRMVDLTARDGWKKLRALVAHPGGRIPAVVLDAVIPALGEPTAECRRFFELLVRIAPGVSSVRVLTRTLRVRPSTFMSRFFRAGLPSPKRYLAATRLLYAASLLEVPGLSIADVAYRLEYSSPQSFGRHVRTEIGVTAGEFRGRYSLALTLDYYTTRLIAPFRATFRSFYPLNHGVSDTGQMW